MCVICSCLVQLSYISLRGLLENIDKQIEQLWPQNTAEGKRKHAKAFFDQTGLF